MTPILVCLKVAFGWPSVFFFTGALGLAWAGLFFRRYREPPEMPGVNAAELRLIREDGGISDLSSRGVRPRGAQGGTVWRDLGIVLGRRKLWGIYFGHFVCGTVGTFFYSWFPTYLVNYRHFTSSRRASTSRCRSSRCSAACWSRGRYPTCWCGAATA
jgi:ACS family D-galactonate transporter-like MFS transporter